MPEGRTRCKACGGPRLLVEDGKLALSGKEREPLIRAQKSQLQAGVWKLLGGGLFAAFALASVAAALLIVLAHPGILLAASALTMVCLPLIAALVAQRRSRFFGEQREQALREAELSAARDLTEATGAELTASLLASALGLREERAELLLAELSLDDVVHRRVTEGGELAYSARARFRVGETASETPEASEDPARQTERPARKESPS
ncbi:MAG TPA: hypothetical protein VGP93_16910 [Polyangiaceae bacterium]|jgi:hypothetical protein|nr:hypothetical protein [Polyangiaceae bacterium]